MPSSRDVDGLASLAGPKSASGHVPGQLSDSFAPGKYKLTSRLVNTQLQLCLTIYPPKQFNSYIEHSTSIMLHDRLQLNYYNIHSVRTSRTIWRSHKPPLRLRWPLLLLLGIHLCSRSVRLLRLGRLACRVGIDDDDNDNDHDNVV